LITVDNGISSIEGVYAAQALGMSVVITDHHLPGEEIPAADVIVNPNLPGDKFKSKNLAGVGVIFYVMLALRAELRRLGWFQQAAIEEPNMSQFLDLVALGTVADVVPLDKNNRVLVQQGLQRIRAGQACAGINALLGVAKRLPERVTATDLGFAVGPRLNAAGRLDDMSVGIECLLSDDADHAYLLALQLDDLNKERRQVEQSMQQDAQVIVDQMSLDEEVAPVVYVLHDDSWHQGVVGLVASRIKERTQRPVVALAPADQPGQWKGSARSVEGVHIRDVLARVDSLYPNLMSKFGGHAMAAGMSIMDEKLTEFIHAVSAVMTEMTAEKDWNQVLWTDGELRPDEFSQNLAEQLRTITPWGQGFPEPVFDGYFSVLDARLVGDTHAKLKLQPVGSQEQIEAICFGYLQDHETLPSGNIRAVYRLDVNEWQGRTTLQLIVQHIDS
jgi:single-stranded-DNA-specific exonuclease